MEKEIEKLVEALKTIKDYCNKNDCDSLCSFYIKDKCTFKFGELPTNWEVDTLKVIL